MFALGDAGRAEMERLSRDADARHAITGLRLLQSGQWARPKLRDGERAAEPDGTELLRRGERTLRDVRGELERQLEATRRRLEGLRDGFSFDMPELFPNGAAAGVQSSGSVVENDRRFAWTIDADGHVKATVKDGKDAAEGTYEAKSVEDLRKEHPEVAKRLDAVLSRRGSYGFAFRFRPPGREWLSDWVRRERGEDRDEDRGVETPKDAPSQPVLGIEWSPVPDLLREHVDLAEGGMVVERVTAGTLAEKLGLRRLDVLVSLDDKPVANAADVHAVLDPVAGGKTVTAVVIRKGKRTPLEAAK